jgi:hypothetical protein
MATTRGINTGNRKVDNCRHGRAANLGKEGKEGSEVKEAPFESLNVSRLASDNAMRGTPLSVGLSRGWGLHSRIEQARRPGPGNEVMV